MSTRSLLQARTYYVSALVCFGLIIVAFWLAPRYFARKPEVTQPLAPGAALPQPAAESAAPTTSAARPSTVEELPPLPGTGPGPNRWDLLDGLSVEQPDAPAVTAGQRVLKLIATGDDGRHAIAARFQGREAGSSQRVAAWIKANGNARVMLEVRDALDPRTGAINNYGVVSFDLAAASVISTKGSILNSAVQKIPDGWQKVWVDLRTADGDVFVLLGLLESNSNRHVFKARGQTILFGGFEIDTP